MTEHVIGKVIKMT